MHTPVKFFPTCTTLTSLPAITHHVHGIIDNGLEKIYGDLTMYVTGTVEDGGNIPA